MEFLTPCDAPPPPPPAATCSYADTTCVAGATCPAGTLVSAVCADRSSFNENPCACTALQQLAAMSSEDPDGAASTTPWNDLTSNAYCNMEDDYDYVPYYAEGSPLKVKCATSDGVQVPVYIYGFGAGLAGALPPSLGELRPPLTYLGLLNNAITSVPTEIGALTGLTWLDLDSNDVTSVPTELGALTGLKTLSLGSNDLTSVPTELGSLTALFTLSLMNNKLSSVPSEMVGAIEGLRFLFLGGNQLTGFPKEFRTVSPSFVDCSLTDNDPSFSCADVGFSPMTAFGSSCCTSFNCPGGISTCYNYDTYYGR